MFKKIKALKHERTRKIFKNVIASLGLRGMMMLINFMLVPLVIDYLNPLRYGIWLTLTSVMSWLNLFDIGLGNGLRNKFAEAKAKSDKESARIYVSTTYAILTAIISGILILFLVINPFLDWTRILNAPAEMTEELRHLVFFIFCFFCVNFILKLISTILIADHKIALNGLLNVISSIITLIIIYILTKTKSASLLRFGVAYSIIPVIVYLIGNIILFSGSYRDYFPSIQFVKLKFLKTLGGLGVQFFIIQIAFIIIFSTNNIIIAQLFSPQEVTNYNISYKYFMIMNMIFSIVMQPFWSGFTEAWHKDEIDWIKNMKSKLIKIWILFSGFTILMLVFSKNLYFLWIGKDLKISYMLSGSMALYVILMNWSTIFTFFINGVGKIRLQLYSAIFGSIINIPLSIFFARNLNLGVSGVIFASCFGQFIASVWLPIQYHKIINKNAFGIWAK